MGASQFAADDPDSCALVVRRVTAELEGALPGASKGKPSLALKIKIEKLQQTALTDPDVMTFFKKVNAAMAEGKRGSDNAAKAIKYLEQAIAGQGAEADPNVRATLSRLYVASGQYDQAIPLLTTLVNEQPGWQDGPVLLAEAYSAAGRTGEAAGSARDHAGIVVRDDAGVRRGA